MKIQIASDLHIEFDSPLGKPFTLEKTDADVIVLAGDIGVGFQQEADFCERLSQEHQKEVVFVLGNHSFYNKGNIDQIRGQWSEADITGVNYLDEGFPWWYKEAGDTVMFTGGILWTDFNGYNKEDMRYAERAMNDYRGCRMYGQDSGGFPLWPVKASKTVKAQEDYIKEYIFTARRSVDEHYKIKKGIAHYVDQEDEEIKKVVVSHYLPCLKSISEEFQRYPESALNPAYASDMEEWIKEREGINLWIHGHTHDSFDYKLDNGTRIVCNPRGYFNYAENEEFNRSLVVEV